MTTLQNNTPEIMKPQSAQEAPMAPSKRPYATPVLERLGDVRDITLAPTPGGFESGLGYGFRG